jgi:hypothetical protein
MGLTAASGFRLDHPIHRRGVQLMAKPNKKPPKAILPRSKAKKRKSLKKAKPGLGPSPAHGRHK